jgi:hypothetical protein
MKATQKVYSLAEEVQPQQTDAPRRMVSGVVPKAVIRPESLAYRLLKPRQAQAADLRSFEDAYACWNAVWLEHFRERDNLEFLPSDDFTRQDEIGTLFHEGECIGMTSHRRLDMTNGVYAHDSYFRAWPGEAIEAACAFGPRLFICSSLTVAPAWRHAAPCPVKELLLALAVERFLDSGADAILGTTRNDRKMNDLGYRLGFRPLVQGIPLHGGLVDLVAFYRRSCVRNPLSPVTEEIIAAVRGDLSRTSAIGNAKRPVAGLRAVSC